jgi:hypothetical protein
MICRIVSFLSFFALSSTIVAAALEAERNGKSSSLLEFLRDPIGLETARLDASHHQRQWRALQGSPACGDQISTI